MTAEFKCDECGEQLQKVIDKRELAWIDQDGNPAYRILEYHFECKNGDCSKSEGTND